MFPPVAFQSALTVSALLFGVFGFLYSVYAMYSSQATPENPVRPAIVAKLRSFCRAIGALQLLTLAIEVWSAFRLGLTAGADVVLAIGLVAVSAAITAMCAWLGFRME